MRGRVGEWVKERLIEIRVNTFLHGKNKINYF